MERFEGRVAVVTGAASGIGRALADRFAAEGMKVVLADVEEAPLEAAVRELSQQERDVIGVQADVRRPEAVEELARRAVDAYGAVHVLCNNAGVLAAGEISGDRRPHLWQQPIEDWRWTLDVNLWGVLHGIRAFVPIMLEQGDEGHVVNTGSVAGLMTGATLPAYSVSKHAVVRLSEALYFQLKELGAPVSASVLCPGGVDTGIYAAERNRPSEYARPGVAVPTRTAGTGSPPSEIADHVFRAIRDDRFYILTHDIHEPNVRMRMEAILGGTNPDVGRGGP